MEAGFGLFKIYLIGPHKGLAPNISVIGLGDVSKHILDCLVMVPVGSDEGLTGSCHPGLSTAKVQEQVAQAYAYVAVDALKAA
jgi:hypothetical protein